jgi:hypothetical protein
LRRLTSAHKTYVGLIGQCAEVLLGSDPDSSRDFDFPEPTPQLVVLVPSPVADYCYLFEALLWVALQRIPLAVPWDEGVDQRVSTEDMDNLEPRLEFEPLSDEDCQRVGLPPNPEHALFVSGDYHARPEDLERILLLDADPPNEKSFRPNLRPRGAITKRLMRGPNSSMNSLTCRRGVFSLRCAKAKFCVQGSLFP